ncbi:spore maturation protein CgeB [Bacillus oleivorans]|uniref:Spore maturation protein CgeB n=1 Tax=Bacillus oleivorans TaxID=1448271 RepID=A0A285D5D4_9BACI|nr:glycosyltransferase [Bacillus oleivorans]SNX74875.1 spore maturation protein CgeB [Bacillus oleivorans]
MNVLFITSGFLGVNKCFEDSIVQSMKTRGIHCEVFSEHKHLPALKHMIQLCKPDFILVMGGFNLSKPLLEYIKQSNIKSAIWMTEDPYYMDFTLPLSTYFTYIFTIDCGAIQEYQKLRATHVYHLPLGTDPKLYYPKAVPGSGDVDICFVGVPYSNRIKLMKVLLKQTDYRILLVGNGWAQHLSKWKGRKNLSIVNVRVPPEIVANYFNQAKINLNIHRPVDEKYNRNSKRIVGRSVNNRTFDIACCEAFQLTDYREDLSFHFEIDKEIVPFQNIEDLLNKIHYYLTHEEERKQIAKHARNRVLSSHTFDHRVSVLLKNIDL